MGNKFSNIKKELNKQYTEVKFVKAFEYKSEALNDYDSMAVSKSMVNAFNRGMDNCKSVYEEAIRKWAKAQNLNQSETLFQIKQNLNSENVKLI